MDLKERICGILTMVVLCLIACIIATGFVLELTAKEEPMIGMEMVTCMYDFGDDLSSIQPGYEKLATMVNREVWEQIRIDIPYRYAVAYYRFNHEETHVSPMFERNNVVLYSVDNLYINPAIPFVLEYEIVNGMVTDLNEYQMVSYFTSDEGVF